MGGPAGWRPRKDLMFCQVQERPVSESPYFREGLSLSSPTDWMKPTCIVEGSLLYSESTGFNVPLI
jgi:hypothetical protein